MLQPSSSPTTPSVLTSLTWTPQQKDYISRNFIRLLTAPVVDSQETKIKRSSKRRENNQ
jgi:hypothetical protein